MKAIRSVLDQVLAEAIAVLRSERVSIYTFAFYHDHESHAVSVCVDTMESSKRSVASSNAFNRKHFWPAIEKGDVKQAAIWNSNIGRSLSLGDFAFVNLGRTDLQGGKVGKDFYLEMVYALHAKEAEIAKLTQSPEALVFCTSGADAEVALVWTMQSL